MSAHVDLWDAINGFVRASGGSTSSCSVAKQNAVVGVERAIGECVRERDATIATLRADLARVTGERDAARADALRVIERAMPPLMVAASNEEELAALRADLARVTAQRDALLPVVRATVWQQFHSDAPLPRRIKEEVDAIDPSMLEEPSDG